MKRLLLDEFAALPADSRVLFFDTETTGMVDWRANARAPQQPRVCQLAAQLCLFGERGSSLARIPLVTLHNLIHPDGWSIHADAQRVHGISDADCKKHGISGATAFGLFARLAQIADVAVSFNWDFDCLMLDIEGVHRGRSDLLEVPACFCAMRAATPFCKLPGRRGDDYKWPKLAEAHQILVGHSLADAHDALADVVGLRRVAHELVKRSLS